MSGKDGFKPESKPHGQGKADGSCGSGHSQGGAQDQGCGGRNCGTGTGKIQGCCGQGKSKQKI